MRPDEMRAEAERLHRKADESSMLMSLGTASEQPILLVAIRVHRVEASLWAVGAEIVERLERDSKARFYDGESE